MLVRDLPEYFLEKDNRKMNPFNPLSSCYRFALVAVNMRTRVYVTIFDPKGLLSSPPLDLTGKWMFLRFWDVLACKKLL